MAASTQLLENKQEPFITVMEALGYISDRDGICHGVSYMSIQAYLVKEKKIFNERLNIIRKIFFDAFKSAKSELANIPEEKYLDENEGVKLQKQVLEKLLKKEINSIFNTLPIELQTDINAFFDGVELYHRPYSYIHLFPTESEKQTSQDAELSHPLVESKKLREEKGIRLLEVFGDGFFQACSIEEVSHSFEAMRSSFLSARSPQPVALALNSFISNHVISVIYYPHTQSWIMIDPNELLEEKETKCPREIAQQVVSALSPSGRKAAFFTKIYSTGDLEPIYRSLAQQWKAQQDLYSKRRSILEMKAEAGTPRFFALQTLQKFSAEIDNIKELTKKQEQLIYIDIYLEQCESIGKIPPENKEKISMLKDKINHAYKVYVVSFGKDENQFEKLEKRIQQDLEQLHACTSAHPKLGFFKRCKKMSSSSQKTGIFEELKSGYNLFVKDIGFFPLVTSLCGELATRVRLRLNKSS